MTEYRWSDDQKRWGPFILSRDNSGPAFYIGTSYWNGTVFHKLLITVFGWTFIVLLPVLRVPAYRIGFKYCNDAAFFHYGRYIDFSDTNHEKLWWIPWKRMEHVRHTYMDLRGNPIVDVYGVNWINDGSYEVFEQIKDVIPKKVFNFRDFDGEELQATTHIEEREWRVGMGWWKTLRLFKKPDIQRYLEIQFSGEVGPKKGSWKGGTIGHSITMLKGETVDQVFARYCEKHNLTLLTSQAD